MITKHSFAQGMRKSIFQIEKDQKIRVKAICPNGESILQYGLMNDQVIEFEAAFLYIDDTTTIITMKFQKAGSVDVMNIGEFPVHLWVYDGVDYGNA